MSCGKKFCPSNYEDESNSNFVKCNPKLRKMSIQRIPPQPIQADPPAIMEHSTIVTGGVNEANKMRLIISLNRLKDAAIPYCLVSEYFETCFKGKIEFDNEALRDMLIYGREDVKNSDLCYQTTLTQVTKARINTFFDMTDVIDGLNAVFRFRSQ